MEADGASAGELYDANYYATHCGSIPYERGQSHWGEFFGGIADALIRGLQPRRVFDAGCAHGFLVEALWDRGVEAHGRDISTYAISQVRPDLVSFCHVGSLAEPIEGRYDLITCIEVLEHMPEAEALAAVDVLTAATERVLFSSSPVDLEEATHVNVKPPIYWLQRFAERGFAPRADFDATFLTPWAMLFERAAEGRRPADLQAAAALVRARLEKMDATRAIVGLQGRVAELVAANERAAVDLRALADAAEAGRAEAAAAREETAAARDETAAALAAADEVRRRVAAGEKRIMDATVVSQALRARAEAAEMRAATALRDAEAARAAAAARHGAERAALQAEAERLAATHAVVVGSSSWRLTAPLRAVGREVSPVLRRRVRQMGKLVWWSATLQLRRRHRQWRAARVHAVEAGDSDPSAHLGGGAAAEAWPAPPRGGDSLPRGGDRLPRGEYEPPPGLLPWFTPLTIEVVAALEPMPTLNVLLPGLALRHLSGGPNTALTIACRLGLRGVRLRLVSVDEPPDAEAGPFWAHLAMLAGSVPEGVEIVDASDRGRPLRIGKHDLFMATAWWTAQMAKYAMRHTVHRRFVYVIQEYEPLLHASSTPFALAQETYGLDMLAVVNTSLLHRFLVQEGVGRFGQDGASALVFEPAVDTELFHPRGEGEGPARRRLLFYARPGAPRNAFELGVAALQKLIAEGEIDPAAWQFVAMGEAMAPVSLGRGAVLEAAPWLDLAGYAALLRGSDVLLSPMLSPHPSYPPLEMAASGRPVVTTVFANKDAAALAALSPLIVGVAATVEGLAAGLLRAVAMLAALPGAGVAMPSSWGESLGGVVAGVHDFLLAQFGAAGFAGYRSWPRDRYELHRFARVRQVAGGAASGLFSLVTTVWNTDPAFVQELAECVLGQLGAGAFEWVILDNGTTREETRALLQRIAAQAPEWVRLERVEENLGIIGGMRWCLERARNRYVVPLDSDDLLTPDALAVLGAALERAGFPPLAYTDEDKVEGDRFRDPYCKPDWDPVLFVHSCYIAHLCAIDREQALRLGAYRPGAAEGSHDWDTFTRFWLAGLTPLHIAEVVYSWRMHAQSTAGNINSKDFIFSSQKAVIELFLSGVADAHLYRVEHSPLFGVAPDWRIVRKWQVAIATVPLRGTLAELARAVDAVDGEFVHLLDPAASVEDVAWADEALTLLHVFGDAVAVGGCVHRDGHVVLADGYAGFGRGWDTPNEGRALADPGYFAQMWKPHSADVAAMQHCVLRREFLLRALRRLEGVGATVAGLAGWLGVCAQMEKRRVVFSPFLRCSVTGPVDVVEGWERQAVRLAFGRVPTTQALLSPRLGRTLQTAYVPVAQEQVRDAGLAYPAQHRAEVAARRVTGGDASCRISLLTTLYSGSRAELLRESFRSISEQSLAPHEWVVLVKGEVAAEVRAALAEFEAPWLRVFESGDLSIVEGMRFCLERATGEYVVPMDYDDVLTVDALEMMADAIAAGNGPGLVYSDEDLLSGHEVRAPYRRAGFDPVLNGTDSYVWHLCAFRRERALALRIYTEAAAEYCHDWDTVTRFAEAGERILHVPEVLYHWRMHEASASNSGVVSAGSLASVRAMLERRIARQARPELYQVATWPIERGFEQLTILRLAVGEQPVGIVLVVGDGVEAPGEAAVWEAVRLFEMHADVGAVGGRVLDADGMVVESCAPMRGESWVGRHRGDGGDYAHALKPQTVAGLSEGLFLCRAEVAGGGGREVAARCRDRGWRLAYSPLVEAWRV